MKLKPVDFARQAGVTKQAVSGKIKNKTLIIDEAGFLDTDNPINSDYISNHGRRAAKPAPAVPPLSGENPAAQAPSGEASGGERPAPPPESEMIAAAMVPAAELLNYTLRDVVMRFGGLYGLEKHAKALRDLTMTAEREQKINERGLKLIPKDFVAGQVFQFIEALMKQLVEYPETAADKIVSTVISDGPGGRDKVADILRDGLSRIIGGAKGQVIDRLNGLRGRHGLGEDLLDEPALAAGTGEAAPRIGGGGEKG